MLSPAGGRARLMVLTFHQVPQDHDPMAPELPHARVFAEQMRWLASFCNVIPLPEAALRLKEQRLPARAACITFDDGYADNHEVAAPILAEVGLPATFFITGGAVERGIMWNDLVIEGLRRTSGTLDLTDLGFEAYRLADDATRRAAINKVLTSLKYQHVAHRRATAESIFTRAAGEEPPRLMMKQEQVAALSRHGFDIGSHTMSHPILKELSPADARQEIEASKDWVAGVTGHAPVSFAYPNGIPGKDFDASHEEMVHEAGFQVAVSTHWACAKSSDSLLALPRFTPWERDRTRYWLRLNKTLVLSYVGG